MDLRTRLLHLGLRRGLDPEQQAPRPRRRSVPIDELIPGRWQDASGGRCFVAEQRFPLTYHHGCYPLAELLSVAPEVWSLAMNDPNGATFDPRGAAFVDTETTGLSRTGGTFAFLVGLGSFEGDDFVLRQFFMPDYGDEPALLDLAGETLGAARGLVSFNGRSFDWPIIETRYILAGRPRPIDPTPHLDLLLLARRLWRRCLASCALSALEEPLLGLTRSQHDVPGYMIPEMYNEYVRSGDAGPMSDVFYHNAMDILSLVTLATRVGHALSEPPDAPAGPYRDPLALGVLYERAGKPAEAASALQAAADSADGDTATTAARRLALLLRRSGDPDAAMAIWREQAARGDVTAAIELAKQYEHRLRDDAAALEVIDGAIAYLGGEPRELTRYERARLLRDLGHRRERVARRVARTTPAQGAE